MIECFLDGSMANCVSVNMSVVVLSPGQNVFTAHKMCISAIISFSAG